MKGGLIMKILSINQKIDNVEMNLLLNDQIEGVDVVRTYKGIPQSITVYVSEGIDSYGVFLNAIKNQFPDIQFEEQNANKWRTFSAFHDGVAFLVGTGSALMIQQILLRA